LTGEFPFNAKSIHQLMYAHLESPPPAPVKLDPQLPVACNRIVAKAMAKSPGDRYATIVELVADVEKLKTAEINLEQTVTFESVRDTVPTILIVEPSKLQARVVRDTAQRAGAADVSVTESAEEAIAQTRSTTPNVVISARHLPNQSGLDLIHQLRTELEFAQTMFVLVSGDGGRDLLIEETTGGEMACVSKKSPPDEILRSIHACTDYLLPTAEFTNKKSPALTRLLLITDDASIPPEIARIIRVLGILDITTLSHQDSSDDPVNFSRFDLVLCFQTGDRGKREALTNSLKRFERTKTESAGLVAILIPDNDAFELRYVQHSGFVARCQRSFDERRFQRLLDVI
jgi:two-component system chemotaxis response regulator CheY